MIVTATYGDALAGWLNGSATDGTGLWALLALLVAVLVLVAGVVLLVNTIRATHDAV